MKYALIVSNEYASYVTSWDTSYNPAKGVRTTLGFRIAEVEDTELFPAEEPLFWLECDDMITSENFYYDENDKQIKPIPPSPPYPEQQ